jgi:hypothetical protein
MSKPTTAGHCARVKSDSKDNIWGFSTAAEGLLQIRNAKDTISCTLKMSLPLMMTPEVWQRHHYSESDIEHTLDQYPAECVTQLSMLLGQRVSSKQVRADYSNELSRNFQAKKNHMDKIMNVVKQTKLFHRNRPILDREHTDHVPLLPSYVCSDYDTLVAQVTNPNINFFGENHRKSTYEFLGVTWVPIRVEHALLMHRVVTWEVYVSARPHIEALIHKPPLFVIQGVRYACTEEACFFTK